MKRYHGIGRSRFMQSGKRGQKVGSPLDKQHNSAASETGVAKGVERLLDRMEQSIKQKQEKRSVSALDILPTYVASQIRNVRSHPSIRHDLRLIPFAEANGWKVAFPNKSWHNPATFTRNSVVIWMTGTGTGPNGRIVIEWRAATLTGKRFGPARIYKTLKQALEDETERPDPRPGSDLDYAERTGLRRHSSVTDEKRALIERLLAEGKLSQQKIARAACVSQSYVSKVSQYFRPVTS